jgi:hypothetical protein
MTLREHPRRRCPSVACRRAGTCHGVADGGPCLRTHEPEDEALERLARKLDAIRASERSPLPPPADAHELELRLAALKGFLEEREAELAAAALAGGPPHQD